MGPITVAREFLERALTQADITGERPLARTIGERLCELAEYADFSEYHQLHGCIAAPLDPPAPEIPVPSTIARCPRCGAPTTDTGVPGCTELHGALVTSPVDPALVELTMRATENHALRAARIARLRAAREGERS